MAVGGGGSFVWNSTSGVRTFILPDVVGVALQFDVVGPVSARVDGVSFFYGPEHDLRRYQCQGAALTVTELTPVLTRVTCAVPARYARSLTFSLWNFIQGRLVHCAGHVSDPSPAVLPSRRLGVGLRQRDQQRVELP